MLALNICSQIVRLWREEGWTFRGDQLLQPQHLLSEQAVTETELRKASVFGTNRAHLKGTADCDLPPG